MRTIRMSWYDVEVTFVEAVRTSQWVRRKEWTDGWMFVSNEGKVCKFDCGRWATLTWTDLVANDWLSYVMQDDEPDPSVIRFKMLELE
jgi:hypothetical protein